MRVAAILPAAGAGRRMGGVRKAFLQLAGKPLLQYSLDVFLQHPAVEQVVIALPADDFETPPQWLDRREDRVTLVQGGAERAYSVRAALAVLPPEIDTVVIHDAARPLVTSELIDRVLAEAAHGHAATVAIAVTDTLHEADAAMNIVRTPDRTSYWRAQTPQAFPRQLLEQAFASHANASAATDEAGLVAASGAQVRLVQGAVWNIKVTTPDDVATAEATLRERTD
jgi:2-C-methyl-D-erythritol 4-phosphate cytidylyltransferase